MKPPILSDLARAGRTRFHRIGEVNSVEPSTSAALREVALCADRAADRVDAHDCDLALDLASRAHQWLQLALVDLREPEFVVRR